MTKVAVLIPGIMGSELYLGDELVWPGPVLSLLLPYRKMEQLLNPSLEARDVIRSYFFSTQYQALIDDLERWGFQECSDPPTLYVFAYDWRLMNETNADKLADLLDRIVSEHGSVSVSLLGHSMGGLIARYYLESGKYSGRKGFSLIEQVLFLGTPHRGAPLALIRILGLEKALWLSAEQVKQAVNHPLFPSAYQLLPPPGEPFTWDEAPSSQMAELDPYDPDIAGALGLQWSSVEAAMEFHRNLDSKKKPPKIRYFSFTGTQQTTATLAMLRRDGATIRVRKIERNESGDGTVPFWSGSLTGCRTLPVGGEHSVIYRNKDVRRVLASLLGAEEAKLSVPLAHRDKSVQIEVAIRERVIRPLSKFRLALDASGGTTYLNGEIRIQKPRNAEKAGLVDWETVEKLSVEYNGPRVETISLVVNGPRDPGAYSVAFYPAGSDKSVGSDEVFVQDDSQPTAVGL